MVFTLSSMFLTGPATANEGTGRVDSYLAAKLSTIAAPCPGRDSDDGQGSEDPHPKSHEGCKKGHDHTHVEGLRKFFLIEDIFKPAEGEALRRKAHPIAWAKRDPDDDEKRRLTIDYKVDEHTLHSSLDPDELARLEFEPEHIAIIYKRPRNFSSLDGLATFKVAFERSFFSSGTG
jgi:hypothetical protein